MQVFTWFFATFSGAEVKRQILTVKNIPQLYKYIAPDQIEIPPFVSDYDLKVRCMNSIDFILVQTATNFQDLTLFVDKHKFFNVFGFYAKK